VLGRSRSVGLCFSDLKLLKQFSGHARKSEITGALTRRAGANAALRARRQTGRARPRNRRAHRQGRAGVTRHKVGERYLVQTDYRWLPTKVPTPPSATISRARLQEYVLMDERVITAPDGESMLIPVPEDLSASAIALCEPWACVEDAYVEKQRQTLKTRRQDARRRRNPVDAQPQVEGAANRPPTQSRRVADGKIFDDVIYFGSDAARCEKLFAKVGTGGLFIIVQGGGNLAARW
jgi:hypothetical protein